MCSHDGSWVMSKSRQELEAEGYKEFQEFGKFYFRLWLTLFLGLLILGIVAFVPLITANYQLPPFDRSDCSGRGCRFVMLLYFLVGLFLTMPIWLKFPIATFFTANGIWRSGHRLMRVIDGKPDFAIGPPGIYFFGKKHYEMMPWDGISQISVVRYRNSKKRGEPVSEPSMYFYGIKPTDTRQYPVWPMVEPLVYAVHPMHGFDFASIVQSIKCYSASTPFSEREERV
jgi:hypothetical protein